MVRCAVILMAGCAFGQTAPSKGAPTAGEQAAALHAIREYALNYTGSLPNYTCTQITRETISGAPSGHLLRRDVIEEQLSFIDKREIRQIARINGRPASADGRDQRMTARSHGEFGNLLDIVFESSTGADIQFDRLATLNRHRVYVFAFHVPQSSGYGLVEAGRTIQVPFQGFVYADYETRAVVRIEMKCIDIPHDSEYRALELTLDYKPAKVAGQEFILPSSFSLYYRMLNSETTSAAEYTAYRRFSANSEIQFERNKE
jgi:hypothetical protein